MLSTFFFFRNKNYSNIDFELIYNKFIYNYKEQIERFAHDRIKQLIQHLIFGHKEIA